MFSRISDFLEHSLANSITPAQIERTYDIISRNPHKLKRVGQLALYTLALSHKDTVLRLIDRDISAVDMDFAGAGAESTVFKNSDSVIKVIRKSIRMSEQERQELASQKTRENTVMTHYLPDLALPQQVAVGPHPVSPDNRAVKIIQPFVDFRELGIFSTYERDVDRIALNRVCQAYPGIEYAFSDLVVGSRRMLRETGFLTDTAGANNIVVSAGNSPELIIIDGQPTSRDNPVCLDKCLSHLDSLEQALLEVA